MNQILLDPRQESFPDRIEHTIHFSPPQSSTTVQFDPSGLYFVCGCSDGIIQLWDFQSKGLRTEWQAHDVAVSAVQWLNFGSLIATCDIVGSVRVWKLDSERCVGEIKFGLPVLGLAGHPQVHNSLICVLPARRPVELSWTDEAPGSCSGSRELGISFGLHADESILCVSKGGTDLYCGTTHGRIFRLESGSDTGAPGVLDIGQPVAISALRVAQNGAVLVALCGDRTLRCLHISGTDATSVEQVTIQDAVNGKPSFCTPCCSPDGKYIATASRVRGLYRMYVWAVATAELVHFQTVKGEEAVCVEWHPRRPFVLVSSRLGLVHVWGKSFSENWTAFAPNCQELQHNVEHVDQEDDFDQPAAASAAHSAATPPYSSCDFVRPSVLPFQAEPVTGETESIVVDDVSPGSPGLVDPLPPQPLHVRSRNEPRNTTELTTTKEQRHETIQNLLLDAADYVAAVEAKRMCAAKQTSWLTLSDTKSVAPPS